MALRHSPKLITDGLVLHLDPANPKSFNLFEVEVLVVAGGGSGGTGGGGGGAGGLVYNTKYAVTPGSAITVSVGGGGAPVSTWGVAGNLGQNSVFGNITAIGGGAGLHRAGLSSSGTGGSGGGDAGGSGVTLSNATAGQGFPGGNSPKNGTTLEEPGGGGGGAGGAGEDAKTPSASDAATVRATEAGAGGPGKAFDISGTYTFYAGGGGGSNRNGVGKPGGVGGGGAGGASPVAGTNGTGGGGGGTGYSGYSGGGTSAAGGSGIVIVRYPGPQKAIGGTVSFVNGYTIHTYNSVGSFTFTPLVATNNSVVSGIPDLSGSNKFGTSYNGPLFNTINRGCIYFDGNDDYILCGNLGSLPVMGTISFWMNSTAVENYRNPLSTNYLGINSGFRWEQYTTVSPFGGFNVIVGNDAGTYAAYTYLPSTLMLPNVWYNVVITWNTSANVLTGYLNGVQSFSNSHTLWPTSIPNFCLGNGFSTERYYRGYLSNCLIYNRVLTQNEVLQNFNTLRGRFGL